MAKQTLKQNITNNYIILTLSENFIGKEVLITISDKLPVKKNNEKVKLVRPMKRKNLHKEILKPLIFNMNLKSIDIIEDLPIWYNNETTIDKDFDLTGL